MRQTILIIGGILAVLLGLLFMLQGLGVIRWPASSEMIDQSIWVTRGAVLAGAGAILAAGARLVPSKRRRDD